ncbi:TetR/AcrR family transcriptional regulator [Streptomyces sp. NPDC002643]
MPRTSVDPRILRSRTAALAAATDLLIEGGPERVTHAAVAERAGIGRATVYRHWPDPHSLLLGTLTDIARPPFALGDGPVRAQLITYLQGQADWLNHAVSASVIATVIERADRDEGVRRIREEMFGRADEHLASALTVAVERGELRPGVGGSVRGLVSRILGPLLFRRFVLGAHIDDDMVLREVDMALAPWTTTA